MAMTLTLKVEKNVYGGDGLGRLGDGRVAFVPGVFAGETIRAEIVEQKKNFVRARCVEILERSPDRVEPGLVVPGMVYAGVNYAAELRFKQDQLGNFLEKIGFSYAHVEVVAGRSEHYRNKATYHVQRVAGKWIMGYRREFSHDVVDVTSDPLACEEINKQLPQIRASVFALLTQGARNVRRSTADAAVTVRYTPIDGVKWWLDEAPSSMMLTEQTAGLRFKVPADGFYQVNPKIADELVKAVRADYLAGIDRAANLCDLYCGVGVFGLACAKGDETGRGRLVGIESVHGAVAAAKDNAAALGVKANFFCERVGANLRRIKVGPHTAVIVDPPRGGMEKGVAEWLAASPAPRIFCVSCDPATLVRDLAPIVKNYRVSRVKLFDLFPRTARFETLVELEK